MKICSKCKIEKDITNFYLDPDHSDGRRSDCKACIKLQRHKRHCENWQRLNGLAKSKRNKYNILKSNLKKFGITPEQFSILSNNQNNKCKICNTETTERLYVDHCHITGLIRGLLCRKCNLGLGFFNDNISLFLAALEYLQDSYSSKKLPPNDTNLEDLL